MLAFQFHGLVSKFFLLKVDAKKDNIASTEQSHEFKRKQLSIAALEAILSGVDTSFGLEEEEDARDDRGDDQRIEFSERSRRSESTTTAAYRDSSDSKDYWLRKSHPTAPGQLVSSHFMQAVFFDTTTVDATPAGDHTRFPPPVFLAEAHSFSAEIFYESCDDLDHPYDQEESDASSNKAASEAEVEKSESESYSC